MNDKIPYVAIIGGFWELQTIDPTKADEAKKYGEAIGAELAKAGVGLVVYFSNDESLEPHVVAGYVAKVPQGNNKKLIRVRFAESQRNSVNFAEESTRGDLFDRKIVGKDWEAPFYRSLVYSDEVDGVLLMAGARSTGIAGQVALAGPLPILAIDKYDGAAGAMWSELTTRYNDYPSSDTHSISDMAAWLKAKCAERAEQKKIFLQREASYLEFFSQKQKASWAAGSFVALLFTVYFGLSRNTPADIYPFLVFVGLIAAGATGALIRSVIWKAEATAPTASLVLGGVAGFVVGIAYLVPQFVGAPGVLEPTATVVQATDKIQFISALLVSISAGVGFDTVFSRLKKQAENHSISAQEK